MRARSRISKTGKASIRAKLDANESPFALGDHVRTALAAELAAALADVALHRYPDPQAQEVRRLLAADLGVSAEQVLATNGSDEGIQILLQAVALAFTASVLAGLYPAMRLSRSSPGDGARRCGSPPHSRSSSCGGF